MRRKLLNLALLLGAALAGAASWHLVARFTQPDKEAVAALFALRYPDLAGQPVDFAQWRGKPLVVNFWASWCGPCREEMPLLDAAAKATPGVQFVGISVDDAAHVQAFVAKTPVSYPLVMTGMRIPEVSAALGNKASALPFTAFVRADGSLASVKLGELHQADLATRLAQLQAAR